jgi:hypothetical protein
MLTAALTQNKRLISLLAALLVSTSASAQVYDPTLIAPQINGAPTVMTPLNLGDDATRRVSLGFEFEYWGQTFTDVWVSSNGFVSFQSAANLCCNGQPLEQAQRNTIYAYWSDLISFTGNPYYRVSDGAALFGWYNVQEFGTNNQNTFEIGLFNNGNIQFNYGSLSASGWRDFTAGITGPEAGDNVSLFYGRNPQFLQNQSGLLSYGAPIPDEVAIDCNATPLHPSCPPASIAINVGAPDPTASALEAAVASVEQTAMQETQEEVQIEDIADIEQVLETAQEALETANASVEAAVEAVAEAAAEAAVEAAVERAELAEKAEAERLSPDQVAALAATGPESVQQAQDVMGGSFEQDMAQQASTTFEEGAQGGQGIVSTQMRFEASASASFSNAVSGSGSSGVDAAVSFSSPMSVASNFEIINNVGSRPVVTAPTTTADQSNNEMAEGQSDTIAEIGSVPAFDAYRQASLSDRADFYAIRDIYRNRRLRDANFEMYRMTQTNDAKWREIVDAQYK